MQFLKRHYEKIILCVVLLGLAAAAVWLGIQVSQVRDDMAQDKQVTDNVPVHKMGPLDLKAYQAAFEKVTNPPPFNISTQHMVFSPVKWFRKDDGSLIKVQTGKEVGVGALAVTKLTPLYLNITLTNVTGTPDNPRYQFILERQAAADKKDRRAINVFAGPSGPGATNNYFTVKEVKGEPANPTDVVLELKDGGDTVTVPRATPFAKVVTYAVDFEYPPESLTFTGKRLDETITVGGETYNIVAITDKQIVLSAPNSMRTFVPVKLSP